MEEVLISREEYNQYCNACIELQQYKQQIDELIKRYKREFENYREMQKDWELDKAKTDDENYKYYCEDVISDCRASRIIYRQVIIDLSKLKERDEK